jgi:hypothetical protein
MISATDSGTKIIIGGGNAIMQQRKIITLKELNDWLTEYVSRHEECDGTTVHAQYKLQNPDSDGCNWSTDIIYSLGQNADKASLNVIIDNAVREARKKFNVI